MDHLTSVAIVDDHPIFRQGLRMVIEGAGAFRVQEFEDGADFVACGASFDVVLLDVCMPHKGGVAVLETLPPREFGYGPIMLGTDPKPTEVRRAVTLGVLGVLRKDADLSEVLDAISHVAKGETYFPAFVTQMLMTSRDHELTGREIEVLHCLAQGSLNKEIADQLTLSVHTVRDVVRRVYRKLRVNTRVDAVRVATEDGLVSPQAVSAIS